MATYTWTGASTDALSTAGNWSPSGPPGNGDTAYFPKDITTAPATSMNGLADTLAALIVGSGVSYGIGSSGNELQVMVTKVVHLGKAALWYDADANTAAANIILAPSAGGSSNILLSGAGTSANIYCLSGAVSITGTGAATVVAIGKMGSLEPDVTIASTLGMVTDLAQYAGRCKSNNAVTRLFLAGGTHEKLTTQEAATVVQTGGVMWYDSTDTVTLYMGLAGTADFTRQGKAVTVTTMLQAPEFNLVYEDAVTTLTTHLKIPQVV